MNDILSKGIIFAAGAAIGSLVAYVLTKKKYEKLIDEEVESVKKALGDYNFQPRTFEPESFEPADFEEGKPAGQLSFDDVDSEESSVIIEPDDEDDSIFIIPPEEFGDTEGYHTMTLTYYSDGILADEHNRIVKNPEKYLGNGYDKHFGEYEDDSVHIRNSNNKYDYEVLYDPGTYVEVITQQYGDFKARVQAKSLEAKEKVE